MSFPMSFPAVLLDHDHRCGDCGSVLAARGLCPRCDVCWREGCDYPVFKSGMCESHYEQATDFEDAA